jgi:plant cysteine oxidase
MRASTNVAASLGVTQMDALRAVCARHLIGESRRSAAHRAIASVKTTASGARAPSAAVRDIIAALDAITIDDLKLGATTTTRNGGGDGARLAPPYAADDAVQYLRIHACDEYTIGAFVFGKRGEIPLHNHPGMTVCSRVIYGETRVTAYDFVDGEPKLSVEDAKLGRCVPQRARLVCDEIVRGGEGSATRVLYPDGGGNVHRLSAVTACAVLDVQSPPYAVGRGRDCHYFEFVDDSGSDDDVPEEGDESSKERAAWLRETLPPLDFSIDRIYPVE